MFLSKYLRVSEAYLAWKKQINTEAKEFFSLCNFGLIKMQISMLCWYIMEGLLGGDF